MHLSELRLVAVAGLYWLELGRVLTVVEQLLVRRRIGHLFVGQRSLAEAQEPVKLVLLHLLVELGLLFDIEQFGLFAVGVAGLGKVGALWLVVGRFSGAVVGQQVLVGPRNGFVAHQRVKVGLISHALVVTVAIMVQRVVVMVAVMADVAMVMALAKLTIANTVRSLVVDRGVGSMGGCRLQELARTVADAFAVNVPDLAALLALSY